MRMACTNAATWSAPICEGLMKTPAARYDQLRAMREAEFGTEPLAAISAPAASDHEVEVCGCQPGHVHHCYAVIRVKADEAAVSDIVAVRINRLDVQARGRL